MFRNPEVIQNIQNQWLENNVFATTNNLTKKNFYVLVMFPYPSGNLHIGHIRNYTIGDVIARFKRANNFNVLHPIGWDAFGLPAENAALEYNIHPQDWTLKNITSMKKELQDMGFSYDWDRELKTCDKEYYKHEQKLFLEMLKMNLVYQKNSIVNWDPIDQTVLANEQVIDGKGWRSNALIEKKEMQQWFLRATTYAQDLYDELEKESMSQWPKKVLTMQQQWISPKSGCEINFPIIESTQNIKVFTTKPEVIFGVSFIKIHHQHKILKEIPLTSEIKNILHKIHNDQEIRDHDLVIKLPIQVLNPLTQKIIPIFLTNNENENIDAEFGLPAHCLKDFHIAQQYDLPIVQVLYNESAKNNTLPLNINDGYIINSDFLNNHHIDDAREKIIQYIISNKLGDLKTTFKLHDWGISRQRYWGAPIPIIYCKTCGTVPVPEQDLPVTLPHDIKLNDNFNFLANHPTWKHVKCPQCSQDAERETDTFDTFFESSWYFLAFCNNQQHEYGISKKDIDQWLPVDCYIGGIEHAILHLLYARLFNRIIQKIYNIDTKEPFKNLLTQGMVCHPTFKDLNGRYLTPEQCKTMDAATFKVGPSEKMSKSKKNVITPQSIVEKYDVDTLRIFILSDTPYDKNFDWDENGLMACYKFLTKISNFFDNLADKISFKNIDFTNLKNISEQFAQEIQKMTANIDKFQFNLAVSNIYILFKILNNDNSSEEMCATFLRVIEPITPHLSEFYWQKYHGKKMIAQQNWPSINAQKQDLTQAINIQINGKMRNIIKIDQALSKEEIIEIAKNDPKVKKFLIDHEIIKIIFVPNKVVNFLIKI